MLSTIGVPLGVVTAKATAAARCSARIAASRAAISDKASSQETSIHPASASDLGRGRLSGRVRRRGLLASSGAALPLA